MERFFRSRMGFFSSCQAKVDQRCTTSSSLDSLFQKYQENGVMGPAQLHKFLVEVQGEGAATEESALQTINNFLRDNSSRSAKPQSSVFTKDNFLDYLFDGNNNPSINSQVHQDMTAPMSHYYIYTGHNSYLTGNQLSSDCSEKPIIDALEKGVRVIELDLWPGTKQDEVMVLHGKTLTSPVKFEKCISAIKQHAFSKSQYPVVITLEDHLTPELQAKVAEIVTETFGSVLHMPESIEGCKEFPSPEIMKGKILISTKPPKEYLVGSKGEASKNKAEENLNKQAKQKGHTVWGDEIPQFTHDPETDDKQSADTGDDDSSEKEAIPLEKQTQSHVAPEYNRIIAIRQTKKPKGESMKNTLALADEFVKRVSLSEPQLENLAKSHPTLLVRFTQKNFLRIYPYGLRLNSSNYNPLIAWSHGAQMVAFNMQGYGRPLWLVHGFFRANGGCGYVKKPDFLLPKSVGAPSAEHVFNPSDPRPAEKILKVKVHMGKGWRERFGRSFFDKFSPPDFYARIGIAGVPADTKMEETEEIEDSWTPCWDTQFEFPLTVPQLALLRIEVHEHDMPAKDDFAGQTCLPVSELKCGLRSVQLCDEKGFELKGVKLLCSFDIVDAPKQ